MNLLEPPSARCWGPWSYREERHHSSWPYTYEKLSQSIQEPWDHIILTLGGENASVVARARLGSHRRVACRSPSLWRDVDFGSKRRKKRLALEAQEIERGQIGFSSRIMACIYSLGEAMIDLLRVMQSESFMEMDRCSKDQGDDSRRVRKWDGWYSKFIAFHNHGQLGSQRFVRKKITPKTN
jgi:hypothetical protein